MNSNKEALAWEQEPTVWDQHIPDWKEGKTPITAGSYTPSGSAKDQDHYMQGRQQTIERMQEMMSHSQFVGFLLGNCMKYADRCLFKGTAQQDAEKLQQYAKWLGLALAHKIIDPVKDSI